jgi:ribonuclease BN (tRNA processing enzyme)
MTEPIQNLRIHFYGTQGSFSTFPSHAVLENILQVRDEKLLKTFYNELAKRCDDEGRIDATLDEVFGGAPTPATLQALSRSFNVPMLPIYSGRTTCVHIETSDGYDIVLDTGSGFWDCAKNLQEKWGERPQRHLYIFGSHAHVDHTEGLSLSTVCFDARNTLHFMASRQFLSVLDLQLGIFSREPRDPVMAAQTPVSFELMSARFEGVELRDGSLSGPQEPTASWTMRDLREPIELGATRIIPFEVYHSAPCLAYRIEHGGKKFVFCTDHELRHGDSRLDPQQIRSDEAEERLRRHAEGADVLYRDAQYLRDEYDGKKPVGSSVGVLPRLDWGHSCIEDVLEMSEQCHVRHTLLGHHDPNREWAEQHALDQQLAELSKQRQGKVELARGGGSTVIDL